MRASSVMILNQRHWQSLGGQHGKGVNGLVIVGAVVQLVEYRTRNREVARSTHTLSTASNLEQVANLLCAQANSASYPQRDGK